MKEFDKIIEDSRISFHDAQTKHKSIFDKVFYDQKDWLNNVQNKTGLLKKIAKTDIDYVIEKLKAIDYHFDKEDTTKLTTFTANINNIIKITNRINNFKEGTKLEDKRILSLFELFNTIKRTDTLQTLELSLNSNLNNFIPHLFSVIKHCQNPNKYPIYYKFWRNILGNVLKEKNDYDSMCDFYREIPEPDKHLNLGAYFGTIGTLIAESITENQIIKSKDDSFYKSIKNDYLNIDDYFSLIEGYSGYHKNYKTQFSEWLYRANVGDSGMQFSYLRALDVLSKILERDIFDDDNLEDLNALYEDLVLEQKKDDGKYAFPSAPSYGKSGFFSASISSYIDFLEGKSKPARIMEEYSIEEKRVQNKLAQAVCVIGESGVGKTYRVNKTLQNVGHKTLFVIVDSMWQHILFDYSPSDRKYKLTKIGLFIKQAHLDPDSYYTIVIDECHKNLEIINDVLLQAISTKRNDGVRFLALNSMVDIEFDFLTEKYGNRILPDNLGFIFISSKTDLIEGNDDLRNRIEIVELREEDQLDDDFTLEYLLEKIQRKTESEYSN